MPRLFLGIDLPDEVDQHLALLCGGIPGARWESPEKFHLTLRFLDEVDGGTAHQLAHALGEIRSAPFELTLASVGFFPPRGPARSLWVGVEDDTELVALHRRIERALAHLHFPPDPRKFAPHVTLARLHHAPRERVAAFLQHHALFRSASFTVRAFVLYSSVLGHNGSHYRIEQSFPLGELIPDLT